MAFIESRLLDRVSMGAQGGPTFSTDVIAVRAGFESRNRAWSKSRHRYEIGLAPRLLSEFEEIKAAFMICSGRANGFRFKDFADFEIAFAEGDPYPLTDGDRIGTAGAGYGVPVYQLTKVYTVGSTSHYRDIRKPVAGTLVLRRGGVTQTAGVGAGQYAIDTATGLVTFVADQTRAVSSHTVGATHVFTLGSAFSPNLAVGGRIYVTGVTGTAATILNGRSHEVTNVAAAVITTATVTTGLTATGGDAFFYPQPTEALDFSCEFDVPVRFDTDQFDAVIRDRNGAGGELILDLPSVPLLEVRGE